MKYVAHRVGKGSVLRLIIGGDNFPKVDPNPNTGEPIATAVTMRAAFETIFHDIERPSVLLVPLLQ
jgi:predicted acyl esterase